MFRLLLALILLTTGTARGAEIILTLQRDGLARHALAVVPEARATTAPVIFVLHGVIETGEIIRAVTDRRFEALGAEYGWVVVYPSAFLRVWNTAEGTGAARILPPRDDIAYLDALLEAVATRVAIDRTRVFAAGFSQGGIMSFAWACKRPGTVRAVAVAGMALPALLADDCATNPPQGVLLAHATRDQVVPFAGGSVVSGPFAWMRLLSHGASVDFFRATNGCSGDPEIARLDARDDKTVVVRSRWSDCTRGAVEAWRIEGGGHRWPNGLPESPFAEAVGPVTHEFDGSAAAFAFFSRFR